MLVVVFHFVNQLVCSLTQLVSFQKGCWKVNFSTYQQIFKSKNNNIL